jgi:hypothetical protein
VYEDVRGGRVGFEEFVALRLDALTRQATALATVRRHAARGLAALR